MCLLLIPTEIYKLQTQDNYDCKTSDEKKLSLYLHESNHFVRLFFVEFMIGSVTIKCGGYGTNKQISQSSKDKTFKTCMERYGNNKYKGNTFLITDSNPFSPDFRIKKLKRERDRQKPPRKRKARMCRPNIRC